MMQPVACLLTLLSFSPPQDGPPGFEGDIVAPCSNGPAIALVPSSAATIRSNLSSGTAGNWSDPNTWLPARLPVDGDQVWIQKGDHVLYDVTMTPAAEALTWLRVDGTLDFKTDQDTTLAADTIVVTCDGSWFQGRATNRIQADEISRIVFKRKYPDWSHDPKRLGLGFISEGKTRIFGARVVDSLGATATFVEAKGQTGNNLPADTNAAVVPNRLLAWNDGTTAGIPSDRVVVAGMGFGNPLPMSRFASIDETRSITGLSQGATDTTLTFDSNLDYEHRAGQGPTAQDVVYTHIANLTRNVKFESFNSQLIDQRGHVMFHQNPNVKLEFASFTGLGRTDKNTELNAPFDPNDPNYCVGETLSMDDCFDPSSTNTRGRYAVHVHRAGIDQASPVRVVGCAVEDSPGWGFVNHRSYVEFVDCVAYNVVGSAFVTEDGGERGKFERCIALYSFGSDDIDEKNECAVCNHHLGRSGNGFWLQSGGVDLIDCVAGSQRLAGFTIFTRGRTSSFAQTPPWDALTPSEAQMYGDALAGRSSILYEDIPLSVRGCKDLGSGMGLFVVDVEINGDGNTTNLIEDFTSLHNNSVGLLLQYSRNLILRDVRVWELQNKWIDVRGIEVFQLIDHLFPLETRSSVLLDGVEVWSPGQVSGTVTGCKNFNSDQQDPVFEWRDVAKVRVTGDGYALNGVTYDGVTSPPAGTLFFGRPCVPGQEMCPPPLEEIWALSGSGQPDLDRATLSPAPGALGSTNVTVTIAPPPGVSGAEVYFMTRPTSQNWFSGPYVDCQGQATSSPGSEVSITLCPCAPLACDATLGSSVTLAGGSEHLLYAFYRVPNGAGWSYGSIVTGYYDLR